MTALELLNEYKQYIKIIERRAGREQDVEKARIIIDALERITPQRPKGFEVDDIKICHCPRCFVRFMRYGAKCCSECGQALDWGAGNG